MRRKAIYLLVLVVCGLASGVLAAQAGAAPAPWVKVGPCALHAYLPTTSNGTTSYASGQVDTCSGGTINMQIEVCGQVRSSGGLWYNKYCDTSSWLLKVGGARYTVTFSTVVGHVYRVWDWANICQNGTCHQAAYQSSAWLDTGA